MEEVKTKETIVNSLIISNVTSHVLKYIKRFERASYKMVKLKRLFKKDESENLSYWNSKLFTLKAKNLLKTMYTINNIMELFNLLDNTSMNPNNWEKLTIMHNALPDEIKNVVNYSADISPNDLYNDIKNKVSIKTCNIHNKVLIYFIIYFLTFLT